MQKQIKYYIAIDPANVMSLEMIDVFSQENGLIKQFQKLKTNVNFPAYYRNIFSFYDNKISEEITELGLQYMCEINKSISKINLSESK